MRQIPTTHDIEDIKIRNILSAMKEAIEILAGIRGSVRERSILASDLLDLGIIALRNDAKTLYNPNAAGAPAFTTITRISSVAITGGISGTLEAIDPVTQQTKTFTITGGYITGMT